MVLRLMLDINFIHIFVYWYVRNDTVGKFSGVAGRCGYLSLQFFKSQAQSIQPLLNIFHVQCNTAGKYVAR